MSNNNRSKNRQQSSQQAENETSSENLQESKLAERQAAIDKIDFDPSEFERLRQENEQLKQDNEALKESAKSGKDGPAINPSAKVTIGNGYRFKVYSIKKGSKLKPREITCCDESEAIRWYCQVTDNPDKPGRQIRAEDEMLRAKCLDEKKRMAGVIHDRRISMLKQKLQTGHQLTADEMDELQKEDEKLAQATA